MKFVIKHLLLFLVSTIIASCSSYIKNKEARNDAKEYQNAVLEQSKIPHHIKAVIETDPVNADVNDDAADDPAIWVNVSNPSQSLIYGSNKKEGGIHTYDLKGNQLQYIKIGKINNIDVRQDIVWGNKKVSIIGGSNRTKKSITIFVLDKNGFINEKNRYYIDLGNFKPYGFCLSKDKNGNLFGYVNNKKGQVYQFSIGLDSNGKLTSKLINSIKIKTQVEGMVVDDKANILYVGEEQAGIHIYDLNKEIANQNAMLFGSSMSNKYIRFDIEGLALLPPHYLIASSQGNFSYAIFYLQTQKYVTSFTVLNGKIDGVEETDGLEVCNANLGSPFNKGILVVQDGFNFDGKTKKSQNFKYIKLEDVYKILEK